MSEPSHFSERELNGIAYNLRANREISLKHVYQIPAGAERWSAIERNDDFAKRAERNLMQHFATLLINAYGRDVIQTDADGVMRAHIVDFGSGSGETTTAFLTTLVDRGITPIYHPVDISTSLLDMCARNVRTRLPDISIHTHPIDFDRRDLVFDLLRQIQLNILQTSNRRNIIGLFLGNTIGNGDAHDLLRHITGSLDVDDKLIIGTHRSDVQNNEWIEKIEKSYASKEPIDFGFTTLEYFGLNREDGEIVAKWNPDTSAIEYHFNPHHNVSLTIGNQTIELRKGRLILFARSEKFDAARLTQLLRTVPLDIDVMQTSPDRSQIQTMATRCMA